MKLHNLLFGCAAVLAIVFVARIGLEHQQLAVQQQQQQAAMPASVERSITTLLQQQKSIESRLETLTSKISQLNAPRPSKPRLRELAEKLESVAPKAVTAGTAAAVEKPAPAADAAASQPTDAACPDRRPFHGLLTSQASVYQQWQSRIMYHHWKKQKALQGPCGDMAGFTRLAATPGGKPDGLENEIPSLFVEQLSDEVLAKHFHFGVLNRPTSIKKLLETPEMLKVITSPFVLILETDHVLMKPIPNRATETKPAAYSFGYMHAHSGQTSIIQKYCPSCTAADLDPVGPSPLLIHLDQLRKITPRWLEFSFGLRSSGEAERVMQGWVQEMWGYSIAAASVGIRHTVLREFQVEHGSSGRPAEDFHKHAYIFHYTYGIEYTMAGRPQGINQIGEWSLDKRHYGADHPPRSLQPPPDGANAAAYWLLSAWNEASAATPNWPHSKSMGTIGWRRNKISSAELEASTTAQQAQAKQWTWAGNAGFAFKPGGKLVTPWGEGVWGVVRDAATGSPPTPFDARDEEVILRCNGCLFADFANANHNLLFDLSATPPAFRAIRVGDMQEVKGQEAVG